jgi:hypothetical protein
MISLLYIRQGRVFLPSVSWIRILSRNTNLGEKKNYVSDLRLDFVED